MLSLFLIATLVTAPLEERTRADVIGWFHIPQLLGSLRAAEGCGARRLVPLLLTPEERLALLAHRDAAVLGSMLGQDAKNLGGRLVIDAGPAAPSLRRGLEKVWNGKRLEPERPTLLRRIRRRVIELVVFGDQRRTGIATTAALSVEATAVAFPALAVDRFFVRLHDENPSAHFLARLDVHRLYGALARDEDAAALAVTVERLGLQRLEEITATSTWQSPNTLLTQVELAFGSTKTQGLFAALSESLPQLAAPPRGVQSVMRAAVKPAVLYWVGMRLLSYHRPGRYLTLSSQLDELEAVTGVELVRDVLGDKAQVWAVYELDEEHSAAVLGLKDAAAARRMAEAFVAAMPPLPRADFAALQIAGLPVIHYRGVGAIAFATDSVVVSTDLETLTTVLPHQRTGLLTVPGEPALVSFAQNDAVVLRRYLEKYQIGSFRDEAVAGLFFTRGALRRAARGYQIDVHTTFAAR